MLCFSAVRTQETLDLLRPTSAEVVAQVGSVLLVGHNPGLPDLGRLMLASSGAKLNRLEAKFPTAAFATLALGHWSTLSPGDAELVAYVVPRQLR